MSATRSTLVFVVVFASAAACATLRAEDWPRWRGPDLNGISREKGWTTAWPKEGPKQLWKAAVGIGFSSIAVADGRAFTMGNHDGTDTVYCFDAETGRTLWKHSYACPLDAKYYEGGPGATPTVDGDRVFTLSKRGHLFCFDAARGTVLWQKSLMEELGVKKPEWGFAGSPLVEGNLLILNLGSAGTAVEKTTGKVVWSSGNGVVRYAPSGAAASGGTVLSEDAVAAATAAGYATPAPYGTGADRAALVFAAKALVSVRVHDGKELWRHPWETRWDISAADPIVIGDRVFISTFDRGCALLQWTGGAPRVVWQNKNIANHFNSCVHLDGYFYGVHGNTDQAERDLRCLDAATGELKWKYAGLGLGSLMAADGKLIVLSDKGELVVAAASPQAFKPLAQAQVLGGRCWTVPVLANGRIYCRNAQGALVCLDVRGNAL